VATVRAGFPLAGAKIVDLHEQPDSDLPAHAGEVTVLLRPFQILTLRLSPAHD
jgi:alpha-mannosidase